MIRPRSYASAPARVTEAKRIAILLSLAKETGKRLRFAVPAATKPAKLRSAR